MRDRSEDLRVLVVDDEPLVSMLLLDIVEDAGFAAAGSASSMAEAVRIAAAERPGIAIVDVNLGTPREGLRAGAELARQGVALIFLSGYSDVAEWPEVQALAPVAVLGKPCAPDKVVQALQAAARALAGEAGPQG